MKKITGKSVKKRVVKKVGKIVKKRAKAAVKPEAAEPEVKKAEVELSDAALLAVNSLNDKKGEDIKAFDVSKTTPMWDHFIICSATSATHVGALRDYLKKCMIEGGHLIAHEDRDLDTSWVVVDFGDILVHIFASETRKFYNLEEIWGKSEIDISAIVKEPSIK
jgi:ribosome-associated protein